MPDLTKLFSEKTNRIRNYLDRNNYDALVIGRQDNFSWVTTGGHNIIVRTSESGASVLVFTLKKVMLIAHLMDGQRLIDEELTGLDIEPVFLKWFEGGLDSKADELTKGLKILSDIPLGNADCSPIAIARLHYPLFDIELERLRWIGQKSEELTRKVVDEIRPGITELEIESMIMQEYAKENMTMDVLLIGSDERITKYRHPTATHKKVKDLVLIHPAANKWGLHGILSRMVSLSGEVPAETRKKYDAVNQIAAGAISLCKPGNKFTDIFELQKKLYKETGYEKEWENHLIGGMTGYILTAPAQCTDPDGVLAANQPYNWFTTITGVKAEETTLNTGDGIELLTVKGNWPVKKYEYNGLSLELPDILIK